MKTNKSTITRTLKSILADVLALTLAGAALAGTTITANAAGAKTDGCIIMCSTYVTPAKEINPCELAKAFDNEFANSFSNFRIVTNAESITEGAFGIGEDIYETYTDYYNAGYSYVLLNTNGTTETYDDVVVEFVPAPANADSEYLTLERFYNTMWEQR